MKKKRKNKVGLIAIRFGFTEWIEDDKYITISHQGNMGNSLLEVDKNLKSMDKSTLKQLRKRKTLKLVKEQGSPDYDYTITFKKNE